MFLGEYEREGMYELICGMYRHIVPHGESRDDLQSFYYKRVTILELCISLFCEVNCYTQKTKQWLVLW